MKSDIKATDGRTNVGGSGPISQDDGDEVDSTLLEGRWRERFIRSCGLVDVGARRCGNPKSFPVEPARDPLRNPRHISDRA